MERRRTVPRETMAAELAAIGNNTDNEGEISREREELELSFTKLQKEQEKEVTDLKLKYVVKMREEMVLFEAAVEQLKEVYGAGLDHEQRKVKIAAVERELANLMKQQREDEESYLEALEQKHKDHEGALDELWERMNEEIHERSKIVLQCIVTDTEKKFEIVNKNFKRVRQDVIKRFYTTLVEEYHAIAERVHKIRDVARDMLTFIARTGGETGTPEHLKILNREHDIQNALLERQIVEFKERVHDCKDVEDDFKIGIITPLIAVQKSCENAKSTSIGIIGVQTNNSEALGNIVTSLEERVEVTTDFLVQVDSLDVDGHVKTAIKEEAELSITQ